MSAIPTAKDDAQSLARQHMGERIVARAREHAERLTPTQRQQIRDAAVRLQQQIAEETKDIPLPTVKDDDGKDWDTAIRTVRTRDSYVILESLGYNTLSFEVKFDESKGRFYEIHTAVNRRGAQRTFYFDTTGPRERIARFLGIDLAFSGHLSQVADMGKIKMDPTIVKAAKPDIRACAKCLKTDENEPVKFKYCQQCKTVYYCSVDCQRAHWRSQHKRECQNVV